MTSRTHEEVIENLNRKLKKTKAKTEAKADEKTGKFKEVGGPKGPEPTRYDDWERKGVARDF